MKDIEDTKTFENCPLLRALPELRGYPVVSIPGHRSTGLPTACPSGNSPTLRLRVKSVLLCRSAPFSNSADRKFDALFVRALRGYAIHLNPRESLAVKRYSLVCLRCERDSWHAPGRRREFCHYALERCRAVGPNGRTGS